jgi:WD40 repeat protein
MFDHLVTPSGSKIAHRPRDLAQYAEVGESEVMPVLEALGRDRIVRAVDGAGGGERYEIFHDVLADGVLAWRARRVIERDREEGRKRQRRLARLAALSLVALAGMTAIAIFALVERSHARSSARQAHARTIEAHARTLEATALGNLSTDPHRALGDAVAAAGLSPGARAKAVLREALVANRLRVVLQQGGPVSVVAYAPHGGRMLAAGDDRRLRIYSVHGVLQRTLFIGHPVRSASFSPNGRLVVATGGSEATLWNAATGARLHRLRVRGAVKSAEFSTDGRLLLTTASSGSTLWHTANGSRLEVLEQGPTVAGDFSPDGSLVATLEARRRHSTPSRARVFDVASGHLLYLLAPPVELEGVAFSPNGRVLATASYRGVYLWRPTTGFPVAVLHASPGVESDVEFNHSGSMLALARDDGATRIWGIAARERRFYLPGHTNPVLGVAWSPDGRLVADASADRTVTVWAVDGPLRNQVVGSLVGHRDGVRSIAWSPDGSSLLTGSADRTARLWNVEFDQLLRRLGPRAPGTVQTAAFAPDGRRVVSAGEDGSARIWSVQRRRQLHPLAHKGAVEDAEFSPDGRFVVTASADRTAGIWDSTTGVRLQTLDAGGALLISRFSRDGTIVVTGDRRGRVQLWRARDGRLLATKGQSGAVTDAAFAPNGRVFTTAGSDGARVWSLRSGKLIRFLGAPGGVRRVAFSPDGSLIAGAGEDGAARLWTTKTGRARVLKVSNSALRDVVFSPDGRLLLVTGPNVQTRDVHTGVLKHALIGHTGRVSQGAFSPDGRWIVTAGPRTVGLWQRDGEQPVYLRSAGTVPKHKFLTSASFSPDGRLVLSSSEDGTVRLYRCEICGDLPALVALAKARLRELRR